MKIKKIVKNIAKKELWSIDKVELEDGNYGIWKNAEKPLIYFYREIMAYHISNFFSCDIVPETEFVTYASHLGCTPNSEYRAGSLQRFIIGSTLDQMKEQPIMQLQILALFDMICNNYDRWHANFLVDRYSKIWAIDNGDILMPYPAMSPMISYLFTGWGSATRRFANEIIKRQDEYLDFIKKEYLEIYINNDTTKRQIYNALVSMLKTIQLGVENYGY